MNYANLLAQLGTTGVIQGNEIRARCPLHEDRNPSFSMNIEKGNWICFRGCGSGDFVRLVQAVLGSSRIEAESWVRNNGHASALEQVSREFANLIGYPVGSTPIKTPDIHWRQHYQSLKNNVMPLWFLERGFTWGTINHWNIKYDPAYDAVVVPVMWQGELVGTVTRHTKEGFPKYQNSSDFPRATILFGEINPNENRIYIVEGLLDCIWAWQCGYNTVALLGSSISNKQIEILGRHRFGSIVLALDNDSAGQKGRKEVQRKLIEASWMPSQISIVDWPSGVKDPQDCEPELLAKVFASRKGMYV